MYLFVVVHPSICNIQEQIFRNNIANIWNIIVKSIYNKLLYNKENSIISVILCTDLLAAYDTVDTSILLRKLHYYGFRGKTHNLFKSYFNGRKQFVCLETFNSYIMDSPEGSVIQGSKMSGTLYNIYVNEIPDIHKLINHEFFKKNN